jgi:C4-dicarboxylate-specific signal transduction histidine kinase
VSPVFDGRSRLVGHLILLQDSTDRQRAEAERRTLEIKALAQSKLATLGEVATGVAHEINQPLTYINTTIQALQEDLRLNDLRQESAHKRLTESLRQVKRITDIVQHLRTFGRADDVDMKAVQLRDVLNDTMLLLGEHLRHRNIEVERRVDEGLPMVEGNASQLEQVLINLFQNSAYALGDNPNAPKISVDMAAYNDSTVRIVFSDNGTGIAPVHMDRIFEPFFTTRAVGEGTGLGLSIVYGIIQDHRGTISCESEHAKGTTFTITLPTDGRGTA